MLRDKIYDLFGDQAFGHGLFYKFEGALRFELGLQGSRISRFLQAFERAKLVLSKVFSETSDIVVCLAFYSNQGSLSEKFSELRGVYDAEIKITKPREIWFEKCESGYRHFILFSTSFSSIDSVLWLALSSELGVYPSAYASVYLVNKENEILANPYDDRGMDVYSPNRDIMKILYKDFHSMLLEYDRPTMDTFYKK